MPGLVGDHVGLPHETRDAEAYQLYANGRFYLRRNEAGMRRSIDYFSAAIERDPAFARAYDGLAEAYSLLGVYGALAPRDAFPAHGLPSTGPFRSIPSSAKRTPHSAISNSSTNGTGPGPKSR